MGKWNLGKNITADKLIAKAKNLLNLHHVDWKKFNLKKKDVALTIETEDSVGWI